DAGIDLLADRKPLGALLRTITRQFRALDEGGEIGADDLHVDTAFLDVDDLAGDHSALLDVAGLGEWIAFQLLDAERDALLLDIDVKHDGLDDVALLEIVDDLLAGQLPVEVRQVHHAVDIAIE